MCINDEVTSQALQKSREWKLEDVGLQKTDRDGADMTWRGRVFHVWRQCQHKLIWHNFTQSISIVLDALVSCKQDRLQCALKDTVAYSRFTQFDRQWIPDGRTHDREGPPTECATSITWNDQAVQVGWSLMSTGDVDDRSAAVDQIPLWAHQAVMYKEWVKLPYCDCAWTFLPSHLNHLPSRTVLKTGLFRLADTSIVWVWVVIYGFQ